jgi:hypothetical protein
MIVVIGAHQISMDGEGYRRRYSNSRPFSFSAVLKNEAGSAFDSSTAGVNLSEVGCQSCEARAWA